MIGVVDELKGFSFGDGGAFPEVHIYQYPQGRDARKEAKAPKDRVGNVPSGVGGGGGLQLVAADQLKTKQFGSADLQRDTKEEIQVNMEDTKAAVENALKSKVHVDSAKRVLQKNDGEMDVAYDPLDPTNTKHARQEAQQKRKAMELALGSVTGRGDVDIAAQAPIVRSPTKKGGGGGGSKGGFGEAGKLSKEDIRAIPTVSNYNNKHGTIYSLEERVAASGGLEQDTQAINMRRIEMNLALDQKLQDIKEKGAQREAEAAEAKQRAVEKEAEELQAAAAAKLLQRKTEQRQAARTAGGSSAEDREALRRQQRELRDRERDEERRQRRMQRIAAQTGVSVDDLANNQDVQDALGGNQNAEQDAVAEAIAAANELQNAGGRGNAAKARQNDGSDDEGEGNLYDQPLYAEKSATLGTKRKRGGGGGGDVFGLGGLL